CALRASGQQPASAPPFSARCRAMRFHVRGVDHLCVCGTSVSSKLPEQVFPDATPRPAHKAIIDRCRRSILGRAIAPATAAFQNMHDTADNAAVVRPLDAPYIRRQMRFDPSPLLVAQPKQVPAHNPDPLPKTNQDRIVRAKKLMSSDPNNANCSPLLPKFAPQSTPRARFWLFAKSVSAFASLSPQKSGLLSHVPL